MNALHVEITGNGPPLVLWHGWGSNLRIFDALCARLQGSFTLHAVDLPGYGQSPAPLLDDAATLKLLHATVPEDAVLLGWSLGGQWAMRMALADSRRLRALVLVHTTPCFLAEFGWRHGIAPAVLLQFAAQLQEDPVQCLRDFLELQLRGSRGAAPLLAELQQSMLQHGMASGAQLQLDLQRLANTDLRAQLAQLRTPALVVGGQHDRVTPPGAAAHLAEALVAARALCISGAAHLGFLSHPEIFDPALREFLAAPAAASA